MAAHSSALRASGCSLRTCSEGRRRRRARKAASPGPPAPLPWDRPGRWAPLPAGLCGAHPGTLATQRARPRQLQGREGDQERRRPTILGKDPAKWEPRSTHRIQPRTQPGRRRARSLLSPGTPPARERSTQPGSRLRGSSHSPRAEPAGRPRPAPDRRPPGAAAGGRARGARRKQARRPSRRRKPSEGSSHIVTSHLSRAAATSTGSLCPHPLPAFFSPLPQARFLPLP